VCEGEEGEHDHGDGVGEVHFGGLGERRTQRAGGILGRFGRRMVEVGSTVNVRREGVQSKEVATDDERCSKC
jgi:hypothetical protein